MYEGIFEHDQFVKGRVIDGDLTISQGTFENEKLIGEGELITHCKSYKGKF